MKHAMIAATAVAAFLLLSVPAMGQGEETDFESVLSADRISAEEKAKFRHLLHGEAPAIRAAHTEWHRRTQLRISARRKAVGTTGRPAESADHPWQYQSVQDASASVVRTYGLPSKSHVDAQDARQRNLIASTAAATRQTVRDEGAETRHEIRAAERRQKEESMLQGNLAGLIAGLVLGVGLLAAIAAMALAAMRDRQQPAAAATTAATTTVTSRDQQQLDQVLSETSGLLRFTWRGPDGSFLTGVRQDKEVHETARAAMDSKIGGQFKSTICTSLSVDAPVAPVVVNEADGGARRPTKVRLTNGSCRELAERLAAAATANNGGKPAATSAEPPPAPEPTPDAAAAEAAAA